MQISLLVLLHWNYLCVCCPLELRSSSTGKISSLCSSLLVLFSSSYLAPYTCTVPTNLQVFRKQGDASYLCFLISYHCFLMPSMWLMSGSICPFVQRILISLHFLASLCSAECKMFLWFLTALHLKWYKQCFLDTGLLVLICVYLFWAAPRWAFVAAHSSSLVAVWAEASL